MSKTDYTINIDRQRHEEAHYIAHALADVLTDDNWHISPEDKGRFVELVAGVLLGNSTQVDTHDWIGEALHRRRECADLIRLSGQRHDALEAAGYRHVEGAIYEKPRVPKLKKPDDEPQVTAGANGYIELNAELGTFRWIKGELPEDSYLYEQKGDLEWYVLGDRLEPRHTVTWHVVDPLGK